jgi:hypothetical protein
LGAIICAEEGLDDGNDGDDVDALDGFSLYFTIKYRGLFFMNSS